MTEQRGLKYGAPLLVPGARIECRPGTDMPVLHLPSGAILLNEGASAILMLCDGMHGRVEIQQRLIALGHRESSNYLDSFLDSARSQQWVIDLRLPATQASQVAACQES